MPYRPMILLCALALLLGACAQAQPTAAPTNAAPQGAATAATVTDAPTATPLMRSTLPPTWTPNWTASPVVPTGTYTMMPEPTVDMTATYLITAPTLEVCANFGEDIERNSLTFPINSSPQVYWTEVEGAAIYRVTLYNAAGEMLSDSFSETPPASFDAEWFELDNNYFWEARPFSGTGVQLCAPRGAVLTPVIQ